TIKDETESLVEGFQVGGVDYITKPFNEKEVLVRVETHLKIHRLTQELLQKNRALEQEIAARRQAEQARNEDEKARQTANERLSLISQREAERWGIAGFVGQSETLRNILTEVRRLQATERTSVLITGESGTGKELIARAIHFGSSRKDGPFFRINCSAIPTALAESLLFGHVQGAFTGAVSDRKGYFELADGGTLFLDEIGEMPLELQVKLLRVFEERSFIPIGGTHEKPVDVRVLAATNADLQAKIRDGGFREDLYFRLAVFTVKVPPLRARPTDIPLLANHFLQLYSAAMGISTPALSRDALEALKAYAFPGNVRELKNIIERALIESGGEEIQPEHLHFIQPFVHAEAAARSVKIPLNMREGEIFLIKRALKQANGNVSEAARLLGVTRATIYRKLGYEGDLS
ncbi:sigma-54-dependent Fis family transcriptional regulator, partial [Candidatus Poribacteria bacterium]|nr:sigma-54-dependent Fis family transcriptional regulator [Candidatus Poribacteria bacterium]